MSSTSFILKSTGQVVHGLPVDKQNPTQPGYAQVVLPYTETEMANRKSGNNKTSHMMVVKTSNLSPIKNFF